MLFCQPVLLPQAQPDMSLAICQMNIICWYFLDGQNLLAPFQGGLEPVARPGAGWDADCWWLMQGGNNRGGRDLLLLLCDMVREKLERSF